MQVNIHEAKTQLSRLAEQVLKGERVVIAKAGKPCVDLVPHRASQKPRKPGRFRGQIKMTDAFDAADQNIIEMFEGKE